MGFLVRLLSGPPSHFEIRKGPSSRIKIVQNHLLLPDHFISDCARLFLVTSIGHLNYLHIRFVSDNLPTTLPGASLVSFLNHGQLEQERPGDGNIGIDEEVVRDLLDGEGLGQK